MTKKHANIDGMSAHRLLGEDEETALEAGKSRWLPRIFQSYGTPVPELMASPAKTGLIFGVPAGLLGAGLGSAIGGAAQGPSGKGYAGLGALVGGLGAGGLAAVAAGMDREAKNEGLEELMRRMPEGAAKRDLLSDPQYQSDFLGWDNNRIVATARAKYYRPTERFSKRTEDMAEARSRYNERNKTSNVNKESSMSHTIQSPSAQIARALLNNNTLTLAEKMAAYTALLQKSALERMPLDPSAIGEADATVPALPAKLVPNIIRPSQAPSAPPASKLVPNIIKPPRAFSQLILPDQPPKPSAIQSLLKGLSSPDAFTKQVPSEIETAEAGGTSKFLKYLQGKAEGATAAGKKFFSSKPAAPSPAAPPDAAPASGMLDKLAPYLDKAKPYAPHLAVGAGGLSALALASYLSKSKKKKSPNKPRKEEEEEDNDNEKEYDMPKTSSVQWYHLAQASQKRANALGVIGRGMTAAPGLVKNIASRLPSLGTALGALGLGAVGAGGAAVARSGTSPSPSTLQQIPPSTLQQIQQAIQQVAKSKYTPYAAAGLGAAGVLGGAAYMGNRAGKQDAKKKKKPEAEKKSNLAGAGMGAGAGAALGGLGGGLYGALAPGREYDPETGRSKRRSRLTAALRGLASGVAVGGAAGGAGGYLAGDNNIKSVLEKFLASKGQGGPDVETDNGMHTDATQQADLIENAKAEASMPRPQGGVIPQGPESFSATTGMAGGAGQMPEMNVAQSPMAQQAPPLTSPAIPQGPTSAGVTAGAPGMYPQGAM